MLFRSRDPQCPRLIFASVISINTESCNSTSPGYPQELTLGRSGSFPSVDIGRLIYQLPIPLCKMFIKEIFGGKSPDDFDEETLTTINKFFENSLNVSETSRQLFIHRNTLVYRLDKLQKSTGLDLRVFEDAITFKIALMVVKYMKYMETFEY